MQNIRLDTVNMCTPTMVKISTVIFYSPDRIVLDLVESSPQSLTSETSDRKLVMQNLAEYWKEHEAEPIDGIRFEMGEIVTLKTSKSHRPAMILDFQLKNGFHTYDLIILESGCIVNTHRMNICNLPAFIKVPRRYVMFSIVDILPKRRDKSQICSWSAETCNELRFILKHTAEVKMEVVAVKKIGTLKNYERLYGNLHVKMSNTTIDVKSWLVERQSAFENRKLYQRVNNLTDEHYYCSKFKDPLCGENQNVWSDIIREPVVLSNITDENLDEYLPPAWRREGSDAIPQKSRQQIQQLLMIESRISFAQSLHVVSDRKDKVVTATSVSTESVEKLYDLELATKDTKPLPEFGSKRVAAPRITFVPPQAKKTEVSINNPIDHQLIPAGMDKFHEPRHRFDSELEFEVDEISEKLHITSFEQLSKSEYASGTTRRRSTRDTRSKLYCGVMPNTEGFKPDPKFGIKKTRGRSLTNSQVSHVPQHRQINSNVRENAIDRGITGTKMENIRQNSRFAKHRSLLENEANKINKRRPIYSPDPPKNLQYASGAIRKTTRVTRNKLYDAGMPVQSARCWSGSSVVKSIQKQRISFDEQHSKSGVTNNRPANVNEKKVSRIVKFDTEGSKSDPELEAMMMQGRSRTGSRIALVPPYRRSHGNEIEEPIGHGLKGNEKKKFHEPRQFEKHLSELENEADRIKTLHISSSNPPSESEYASGAIRKRPTRATRNELYGAVMSDTEGFKCDPESLTKTMQERSWAGSQIAFVSSYRRSHGNEIEKPIGHEQKGSELEKLCEDKNQKRELFGKAVQPVVLSLKSSISSHEYDTMKEQKETPTREILLSGLRKSSSPIIQDHRVRVVSEDAQKLLMKLFNKK